MSAEQIATVPTGMEPGRIRPTELRVHGVSGTPAAATLDRPLVGRVAGDKDAGFYRPLPEYGGTTGPGGARLEAYRWGNLTSGAAARALWLLLLPFTLSNVAVWLRPPAGRAGRTLVRGLSRVFALTMTATLILATTGISLDLVAWQCAVPGSRCTENRPYLNWFFTGFFAPTGRRLALAALVPLVVIGLLWFLARRTWGRYESYQVPNVDGNGDGLAASSFWAGRAQVGRLRSLHVGTALATVDAILIRVLLPHDLTGGAYQGVDLGPMTPSAPGTIGRALAVVCAAVLVASVILVLVPAVANRSSQSPVAVAVTAGLRWMAVILTVLTLAYALVPRTRWATSGPLPGYADAVTLLFAVQMGLIAVLVVVVACQRHRARGALLGGFGTPIVASLALGLGAAFSAGVSYRVADFLDRNAVPSPADFGAQPGQLRLQPPISYQWAALGFLVAVVAGLIAVAWLRLVTLPRLRRRARADTDQDFPGGRQRDPGRAAQIDSAIAGARLTDHLGRFIGALWVVLIAVAGAVTVATVADIGPVQLAASGSTWAQALSVLVNLATYLISLFALGLILLGVRAYHSDRVRRVVGIVWDLGTFWPRTVHPLAAPCYAERAVPELAYRATWLATGQGGVVLSGHSQGSVLTAVTVLQLSPEARARTALLTYGAPLRRLYARLFPAYVNDDVLDAVGRAVADQGGTPRWTNLWRYTDPIGGPAGTGDVRMVDPDGFYPPPGDRVSPAIMGHSGYQVSAGFGVVVSNLLARLRDKPPTIPRPAPPSEPTQP